MAVATNPEILNVGDVARIANVHYNTALRWCNSGVLPAAKLGYLWRIRKSDLDALLAGELR